MSRVALQTLLDRSVKNLGAMDSRVRDMGLEIIRKAYKEGINVQFSSGLRTNTQQAHIYGQGRPNYRWNGKLYGRAGSIVSNAQPGQSVHNYGLAIDYFLVTSDGSKAVWSVNSDWRRVAAIAKSMGFTWGGDWTSFRDYPHIEFTKGLTWRDLKAGKRPSFANVSIKPETKGYLEIGDEGAAVKTMQQLLVKAGHKISADGVFGSKTEAALKAFQKKSKLTADGVYGAKSKVALEAATKPKPTPVKPSKPETKPKEEVKVAKVDSNEPSVWAKEHWEEAVLNGYFDGSRPKEAISRQESAIVVNRLRHNFLELIKENERKIIELEARLALK